MILTALHGFLGKSSDWKDLFQGHILQDKLQSEDLFAENILDMWQWAKQFNSRKAKADEQVLIGYSLGGRLALHALISNPHLWTSAVIVSAHLGLKSSEKMSRGQIDEEWAQRFESDSWSQLMVEWNNREVFKQDSFHFKREEKDYSRAALAAALRNWSLSKQSDLKQQIMELPMPILWIAGAEDVVYATQALKLHLLHPLSEIWVVPETGHRVPWQCPERFLLKITQFLEMVYPSHII
ncbi:MAG: alpha/beta fold hydrolase [Parachlamydiaceae bacterium]|nr:alpha/beta fold hydrolase [Parachlamydiaceae bacterium]